MSIISNSFNSIHRLTQNPFFHCILVCSLRPFLLFWLMHDCEEYHLGVFPNCWLKSTVTLSYLNKYGLKIQRVQKGLYCYRRLHWIHPLLHWELQCLSISVYSSNPNSSPSFCSLWVVPQGLSLGPSKNPYVYTKSMVRFWNLTASAPVTVATSISSFAIPRSPLLLYRLYHFQQKLHIVIHNYFYGNNQLMPLFYFQLLASKIY